MKLQFSPRPLEAIDAELKKAGGEIRDGEQREFQIENIARNWLRADRAAATKWINAQNLPADKKQELLKTK